MRGATLAFCGEGRTWCATLADTEPPKDTPLNLTRPAVSAVDAQENLARLDDGMHLGALLDLQLLERGHGDRGRDDMAAADVDPDDGRHLALVDRHDFALQNVAGT